MLDQTELPEIRNDRIGFEKQFLEYPTHSLLIGDSPILNQFLKITSLLGVDQINRLYVVTDNDSTP